LTFPCSPFYFLDILVCRHVMLTPRETAEP
jgi:hypothetical protein